MVATGRVEMKQDFLRGLVVISTLYGLLVLGTVISLAI